MESEHSEECLERQHRDNVGYLAGHALAGILANDTINSRLTFHQVVGLAANYAEALAKRLDNPSQAGV